MALGVTTNQLFLQRCLAHPVFAAGGASTAFIAQHQEELLAPDDADAGARRRARRRAAAAKTPAIVAASAARMTHTLPISLRFTLDGRMRDAGVVRAQPDRFSVRIGEQRLRDRSGRAGADARALRLQRPGRARGAASATGALLLLHYRGRHLRVEDRTRAAAAERPATLPATASCAPR